MRLDHERVRWHRDRLGWTLDTLAEKAEVAKGTVLRAEHGEDVRPSSGRRIARALGVEIPDLIPEKPGAADPKEARRSSLEPSFNDVLEGERRKDVYLPWLEFANRYADRWHEKARQGRLDRGAYYEWKETLHDLSATTRRLEEEEEQDLSPEQRRELEDDLIMWQVRSRLI